jgi:hypothetical protein
LVVPIGSPALIATTASLAKRVGAGELTANAAAELAGFRKKRERKKQSAVDRALKVLAMLTVEEWDEVKRREDRRRQDA